MTRTSKDTLFNHSRKVEPFSFDQRVAAVFPDMIERSVPGYSLILDGIGRFARHYLTPQSNAYDLGCSLGAAALSMSTQGDSNAQSIVAVDNSPAMIERCKLLVSSYQHKIPIEVIESNIEEIEIKNASMIVLNFTLQFLPEAKREFILKTIYDGLLPGGILILSEKFVFADKTINDSIIEQHHTFKRDNGYSDLEISQKRNALEKVLIPESRENHITRLRNIGFAHVDIWLQAYNFCSFLAIK